MSRISSLVISSLTLVTLCALPAGADRAKVKPSPIAATSKDLGTWDCNGSPVIEEVIAPGEHAFAWRGECVGAEGFAVVIEPKPATLITREAYDAKTKRLVLRVENRGTQPVRVKLHVFVGFA